MSRHLYVYYKVYELALHDVAPQSRWLVHQLAPYCARAVLRKRIDSQQDYDTWMEVYEGVSDEFPAQYDALLAQSECHVLRQLERHEEWFDDLPLMQS